MLLDVKVAASPVIKIKPYILEEFVCENSVTQFWRVSF